MEFGVLFRGIWLSRCIAKVARKTLRGEGTSQSSRGFLTFNCQPNLHLALPILKSLPNSWWHHLCVSRHTSLVPIWLSAWLRIPGPGKTCHEIRVAEMHHRGNFEKKAKDASLVLRLTRFSFMHALYASISFLHFELSL